MNGPVPPGLQDPPPTPRAGPAGSSRPSPRARPLARPRSLARPPALRPGDRVAVLSVSGLAIQAELWTGLDALRSAGRVPVVYPSARDSGSMRRYLAGDDNLRAGELRAALADPSGCHIPAARRVVADDRTDGRGVMGTDLALLRGAKTILLTTYKRDGTPVATPVSIAFDGDRAFFRSWDKAWKTKRLRNNPEVEAAPSTLRGKATGPPVHVRATLLDGEQARVAARALARHHRVLQGLLVPLTHRMMRYQTMHYELRAGPARSVS